MKNVNTFWTNTRERSAKEPGLSITIPDMSLNIADLIKTGTLDSVTEKLKKRMIYGNKIKIEDLTQLDYFKKKIVRYENLVRANQKHDVNTYVNDKQNETVETEGTIPESKTKAVKITN